MAKRFSNYIITKSIVFRKIMRSVKSIFFFTFSLILAHESLTEKEIDFVTITASLKGSYHNINNHRF